MAGAALVFSAMLLTAIGLTLMVPNPVALVGLAALVAALELQVRGVVSSIAVPIGIGHWKSSTTTSVKPTPSARPPDPSEHSTCSTLGIAATIGRRRVRFG